MPSPLSFDLIVTSHKAWVESLYTDNVRSLMEDELKKLDDAPAFTLPQKERMTGEGGMSRSDSGSGISDSDGWLSVEETPSTIDVLSRPPVMQLEKNSWFTVELIDIMPCPPDEMTVLYCFRVQSHLHDSSWICRRRFSAFVSLHDQLRCEGSRCSAVPLPQRHPWLFTDGVFARRAARLQVFSQAVLDDESALRLPAVGAFFGLDEHLWRKSQVPSTTV